MMLEPLSAKRFARIEAAWAALCGAGIFWALVNLGEGALFIFWLLIASGQMALSGLAAWTIGTGRKGGLLSWSFGLLLAAGGLAVLLVTPEGGIARTLWARLPLAVFQIFLLVRKGE